MRSTDEAGELALEDSVEGRGSQVVELLEGKMTGTLRSESVSTKLQRIAEMARRHPQRVFTSLSHVIDVEWLKEAYRRTRKDGAVGVDGQSAADYASNLEANLSSLLERFHKGTYRAPPVRRVHIPKGDGRKTRPIGIPTFEDKVLQRAVCMLLEAIYEQDFLDCSYGFRPRRSAHQALKEIQSRTTALREGWVVEVDVRGFFDSLDHQHLRAILDKRVKDGTVRRAIHKWLKAGVLEGGALHHPTAGTPQGGVISPLLANVYLHEVLDEWFEWKVKPRLTGRSFMVRYADDFVIVLQMQRDAERVMEVLPKRFGKYGLTLHPDKTGTVAFSRPREVWDGEDKPPKPGSFDFLGFTHYWAKSRKGNRVVKQKTAKDRMSRALRSIRLYCRRCRHLPVRLQYVALSRKLHGHYSYYGITGNGDALSRFRHEVERTWRKWLNRRSWNAAMTWERFLLLQQRYLLPPVRVVHSVVPSEPMT